MTIDTAQAPPAKKAKTENGHAHGFPSPEQLKDDLAAAHRVLARWGMDELIWNHISARTAPGSQDFWITPGDRFWKRMQPEHLVCSSSNETADVLHGAFYQAREDIMAVVHCHAPAIEAVSCLEGGLQFISQTSALLYDRVAYHDWEGLSLDRAEGPRIAARVQAVPRCNTLIMRNHGSATFGRTVGEAVVLTFYLNRACEVQLKAAGSTGKVSTPSTKLFEHAASQYGAMDVRPGAIDGNPGCEWPAMREWLREEEEAEGSSASLLAELKGLREEVKGLRGLLPK
eukprot:CAMPEP_0204258130 /NCGR_PEP_ID=MMETSP0468-20130131/4823_1 /ASSEMBLY_ACC=CAM_ASM_000383 /TAXON_ID=2969 /ORGANISM="Oxyrrhis marina" /LENGTH=285 /DNA_ID=CAMNT_0051232309 /DNA_START=42 /DNA_END=899 /DNA_ORIENTATION=-